MELTPDQLAAARARGCDLSPATDDQVRRLSMQRRIFTIEGLPCVATRGGGLLETHGTLAALIEGHVPEAPERDARAEPAPIQETAPPSAPEVSGGTEVPAPAPGAPIPDGPASASSERKGRRAPAAKPRKARTPPPEAAPASTAAAATGEAGAEPSEAADMLAGVEASQPSGRGARVIGRRRAGEPKTPRWAVAGKIRRGRIM